MLELDICFCRGDFRLEVQETLTAPITGILGHSGCGKSTLLAAIAGLLHPQQGRIILNNQVLFDSHSKRCLPAQQRHIGLVFQDRQLFPHLSVESNLLYGYRKLQPTERRFSLQVVTEVLEINHLLTRKPRQLSGGEQQRVALGRAILYAPQLLLLDEPLSALDERLKQQILPFLARIHEQFAIPMLYVSHARSEIEYLTNHWLEMEMGRVIPHNIR